jgi:hypothetical protein
MPSKEYQEKFAKAAYDTAMDNFMYDGYISEENAPLEFTAILKEGIDRYFANNPDAEEASLALIDFPSPSSFPPFFNAFVAVKNQQGGYFVGSDSIPDYSFAIPPSFERFGFIVESRPDMTVERPTLPTGYIGDGRLDNALEAVKIGFNETTPPASLDDLTFTQAFARQHAAGVKEFEYRGEKYSTEVDPFGSDRTTGLPREMSIPPQVMEDPLGADYTGQMVIADE